MSGEPKAKLQTHGHKGTKAPVFHAADYLTVVAADRATVANMAPKYGATMGFFPVDQETLEYLRFTNRDAGLIALVEVYTKEQGRRREDVVSPGPRATATVLVSDRDPLLSPDKRKIDAQFETRS